MDLEDNILFITGRLAENNLKKVIELIENKNFKYEVRNLGINVAALMTIDIIEKNIGDVERFNKIIIPGKARGDIEKLSEKLLPGIIVVSLLPRIVVPFVDTSLALLTNSLFTTPLFVILFIAILSS